MEPIYKALLSIHSSFTVAGKVKAVYDMNELGTLMPVKFTQSDDQIKLENAPSGSVYYRYKKYK